MRDVQAVILAGGKGTRLRPITAGLPKPLVPIANRPLVVHQLAHLARSGVRDVTLALGYAAHRFAGVEREAEALGLNLAMVTEPSPLGTGGALRRCADEGVFDPDRPLLWVNGDVVAAPDVSALFDLHTERDALVTFWLTRARDVTQFGVLELASDGFVERFLEKPAPEESDSHLINAGILMLDPKVLQRIPAHTFYSFEKELLPTLVSERAPLYGMVDGGYWLDTGRPRDYRLANRHVLEGRIDYQPAGERLGDALWAGTGVKWEGVDVIQPAAIGNDVVLEEGAQLFGRTIIGDRSHVHRGAELEDCVLFDDVLIEPGAAVLSSVVCEGARVERGAVVRGSIVGAGAVVGAGNDVRSSRLGRELVLPPESLRVDL